MKFPVILICCVGISAEIFLQSNQDSTKFGRPNENETTVIALYDQLSNVIIYKDQNAAACFIEETIDAGKWRPGHQISPKILPSSPQLKNPSLILKSEFLSSFCGEFSIFKITDNSRIRTRSKRNTIRERDCFPSYPRSSSRRYKRCAKHIDDVPDVTNVLNLQNEARYASTRSANGQFQWGGSSRTGSSSSFSSSSSRGAQGNYQQHAQQSGGTRFGKNFDQNSYGSTGVTTGVSGSTGVRAGVSGSTSSSQNSGRTYTSTTTGGRTGAGNGNIVTNYTRTIEYERVYPSAFPARGRSNNYDYDYQYSSTNTNPRLEGTTTTSNGRGIGVGTSNNNLYRQTSTTYHHSLPVIIEREGQVIHRASYIDGRQINSYQQEPDIRDRDYSITNGRSARRQLKQLKSLSFSQESFDLARPEDASQEYISEGRGQRYRGSSSRDHSTNDRTGERNVQNQDGNEESEFARRTTSTGQNINLQGEETHSYDEEERRRIEQEDRRLEEEDTRRIREEIRRAEEDEHRRLEEQRRTVLEEQRRLQEDERKRIDAQEQRSEEERRRSEEDERRRHEEQRQRLEEQRRRFEEEQLRRSDEEQLRRSDEEQLRRSDEERRRQIEEASRRSSGSERQYGSLGGIPAAANVDEFRTHRIRNDGVGYGRQYLTTTEEERRPYREETVWVPGFRSGEKSQQTRRVYDPALAPAVRTRSLYPVGDIADEIYPRQPQPRVRVPATGDCHMVRFTCSFVDQPDGGRVKYCRPQVGNTPGIVEGTRTIQLPVTSEGGDRICNFCCVS